MASAALGTFFVRTSAESTISHKIPEITRSENIGPQGGLQKTAENLITRGIFFCRGGGRRKNAQGGGRVTLKGHSRWSSEWEAYSCEEKGEKRNGP